jgi:integrative and conjugative element protein (TIGR02256 family)
MLVRAECLVWLPFALHQDCIAEANRCYQLETGGALMGYWHGRQAVITEVIGAGPAANHQRYSFEPDQEWQVAAIAGHYEASGRRETYLGDWHSHPDAQTGGLSLTDRRVLRRIITTPSARAPSPLMMVYYGDRDEWQTQVWVADLKPRPIMWSKLLLEEAALRLY